MSTGSPVESYIQRSNFIVSDLDHSLRIYRDVLGFSVDFIKQSDAASYSYPVVDIPREAILRFCVLSAIRSSPDALRSPRSSGSSCRRRPARVRTPWSSGSAIWIRSWMD